MSDPDLSLLFPTDAPSQAPDWFAAQRHEAGQRLSGAQARDKAGEQADTLFGREPGSPAPAAQTGDPAKALFTSEAAKFDGSAVAGFFDTFAGSAIVDGDRERARELGSAKEAMIADFQSAGTDPDDVREALDIVRERQGDTVAGPVSAERLAEEQAQTLALLAETGVSDADLNAARAFIRDLETIAPGTMRSLEATGAGNDIKLVRRAIAEARRRGY